MLDRKIHAEIFESATRSSTVNSRKYDKEWVRGVVLFLDVSAATSTPTLDVKLQGFDPTSDQWFDVTDGAIAQQTGTGQTLFTIYPGINDSNADQANITLPKIFRWVATFGGSGDITYSMGADFLA